MSGHSKWHNIQNKKNAEDKKKSKAFSQLSKNIRIAVRSTGIGDPKENASLRVAIEKARETNMPHENIQRAIDRGLGKGGAGRLEEVVYEGYGAGGYGVLVIVLTDNKQRTGAEIRHTFDTAGGSLGGPGSAMYLFKRSGADYKVTIPFQVESSEDRGKVQSFIEELEENDDVEDVYTNATWEGKE